MTHDIPQTGGPAASVNGHSNVSVNGSSGASIKDQKPEPESVFWEVPDAAKAAAQSTSKDSNANKFTIDGEFYRRVGFYSAFNQSSDEEFRNVLRQLHQTVKQSIDHLTKELNGDLRRFKDGKADAEAKIGELKTLLARYEQQVEDLKDELLLLKARLHELRGEIKTALIEIGTKKETLIKDRQEALFQELNRLNSELENVVKKRMNLNEEIFEKQKEVLKEKRAFLTKLFEKYDDEHKQVVEKLALYSIPGFHALSSTFLYNAGLISATVAGGFFGSFAEANSLASGGAFSFVVQSLFAFSTSFLNQDASSPWSRLLHAAVLLGIFLFLLVLMFGVSWLCEWAYQRLVLSRKKDKPAVKTGTLKEEDGNETAFAFNFETSDELPITAKISSKSLFVFWLRLIPFLLFLSIVFILVSLGTDVSTMKSVDASVAGYGIGFLIAVASAGISYVYLTMFLERRVEQELNKQRSQEIGWAKLNLELLGIIVAFIAVVMITLLGFQYPFKSGTNALSVVSFMFFVAGCLITAFTLGYGIRLHSLQVSRAELERECDVTQNWLIRVSRPLQIYLTPLENVHFNRKFILIRDEIMNLMLERTRLTRRAAATPLVKPKEKHRFFANLNRWWKRFAWRTAETAEQKDQEKSPAQDQSPQHEPGVFSASDDVKLAFPRLDAELTSLESEAEEVRSRIATVEKEIRFRAEQKGDFYTEKTADLKHQEVRSRNYHKAMTNREKRFHEDVDGERWREEFYVQKVIEGYELGDWFKKHGQPNTVIPQFARNGNGKHDSNSVELDTTEG